MATLSLGNQTIFTQSGNDAPVMTANVDITNVDLTNITFREAVFSGGYKFQSGQGVFTAFSPNNGSTWLFDIELFSKNIAMDFPTNRWTHTYTGYYMLTVNYRHQGSDVWSFLAVTKNGDSEAVGVSGRTGSTTSEEKSRTLMYRVDSTSSTYQLQGWCFSGSESIGYTNTDENTADGSPVNPTWTYSGLTTNPTGGGTSDPAGLIFGCSIYRVGDL